MNGPTQHLIELATLKAQLEEAQSLLAARQRAARRITAKSRKARERIDQRKQAGLHDYTDWLDIADASVAHAEGMNALDDLAVAYLRLSDAASQLGNHIQEGIRAKYYD